MITPTVPDYVVLPTTCNWPSKQTGFPFKARNRMLRVLDFRAMLLCNLALITCGNARPVERDPAGSYGWRNYRDGPCAARPAVPHAPLPFHSLAPPSTINICPLSTQHLSRPSAQLHHYAYTLPICTTFQSPHMLTSPSKHLTKHLIPFTLSNRALTFLPCLPAPRVCHMM